MRKIVCLTSNDLNYDQRMHRICAALSEHDHRVTLLGRTLNNSKPLTERTFDQRRISCIFSRGPLFYLELNLRYFVRLMRLKPDIINTVDADTLLSALLYKMLKPFVWVHDAHELFTEVPELTGRRLKKSLWHFLERISLKKVERIYTVSASISEYYEKICRKKVEVIRNLPALRSIEVVEPQSENPGKVCLLYQGALNVGRCVDLYILAMHRIEGELWIAGEGDLSDELRARVRSEHLENKVRFLGYLLPEELRQVTAKATIGLNVLENLGQSYYYSLSNKCFDYIQAGIPSIHSRFPEYVKLHEEYDVFAFAEANVASITDAINLLVNDRDVYEALKKNCNIAAQSLVWTTEKEKLLAIYDETR